MGDRNDNHFVPKFYLRYWSADQKRTNLFNFTRRRAIDGVSISDQCQRRNFYAFAPKLEDALGGLEGATAEVIRMVKAVADVPPIGTEERETLLSYIVFQKLRTTNAGHLNDAMTEYLGGLWLEGTEHEHLSDKVKLKNIYPVAIPMSQIEHVLPIASDLHMHLFLNQTKREFITSDDPVVLHNQYCEGITYRGVLGWNCIGLQVLFPLSPKELVMLFDPTTYKVGRAHRGVSVTKITDDRDVVQLNSLQILNAHHNVYYSGVEGGGKVRAECTESPRHSRRIHLLRMES